MPPLPSRTSIALSLLAFGLSAVILGPAVMLVPILLGTLTFGTTQRLSFYKNIFQTLHNSQIALLGFLTILSFYVSSVGGLSPSYSLRHWGISVFIIAIGIIISFAFGTLTPAQIKIFWQRLTRCLSAILGVALFIALFEPFLIQIGLYEVGEEWTQTRLRFFSSALAVMLPLCWAYWLQGPQGKLTVTNRNLIYICASGIMVLVCAGRAGWMGMAVSAPILAFMLIRYHGLRLSASTLVKTALASIVSLLIGGALYAYIYGLGSVKERIGITVPDRGLGGGRLDIWQTAWNHMFDNPLFGIGVESFRYLPGADYHPHNFLLQWGLEGGLIGFALAISLASALLIQIFKRSKTSLLNAAIFSGLCGYWVCALTNKSIFDETWLAYLVVLTAIALRPTKK